jgi:hypothetical protein
LLPLTAAAVIGAASLVGVGCDTGLGGDTNGNPGTEIPGNPDNGIWEVLSRGPAYTEIEWSRWYEITPSTENKIGEAESYGKAMTKEDVNYRHKKTGEEKTETIVLGVREWDMSKPASAQGANIDLSRSMEIPIGRTIDANGNLVDKPGQEQGWTDTNPLVLNDEEGENDWVTKAIAQSKYGVTGLDENKEYRLKKQVKTVDGVEQHRWVEHDSRPLQIEQDKICDNAALLAGDNAGSTFRVHRIGDGQGANRGVLASNGILDYGGTGSPYPGVATQSYNSLQNAITNYSFPRLAAHANEIKKFAAASSGHTMFDSDKLPYIEGDIKSFMRSGKTMSQYIEAVGAHKDTVKGLLGIGTITNGDAMWEGYEAGNYLITNDWRAGKEEPYGIVTDAESGSRITKFMNGLNVSGATIQPGENIWYEFRQIDGITADPWTHLERLETKLVDAIYTHLSTGANGAVFAANQANSKKLITALVKQFGEDHIEFTALYDSIIAHGTSLLHDTGSRSYTYDDSVLAMAPQSIAPQSTKLASLDAPFGPEGIKGEYTGNFTPLNRKKNDNEMA